MSEKKLSAARILPWLMIVVAGASLRTGFSSLPPVLNHIQQELSLSSAALGILTTIPVVCMGALSSIGYALEARMGMKRAVMVALGGLTIAFLLRLEAKSYVILLMTAGLVGIADAIIRPLLAGFIKHCFPAHASAAMAVYVASMGAGAAAAAYGTQKVNAWTHSWTVALAVWALPTAVGWVIWLFWKGGEAAHDTMAKDTSKVYLITRLEIIGFTTFFGLQAGLNYVLIAWLPTLYKEAGYTDHMSAVWFTIFILLTTASGLLSHWITRALKLSDTRALWLYSFLAVVGTLTLPYISRIPWCAPALIGLVSGGIFHLALMMPLHFSNSPREATRLSGITQSGGYVIGGLLPWIAGMVSDRAASHSGIAWFVVAISLMLLGTAFWIGRIYRKYHYPPPQNDSYDNLSEVP